MGLKPSLIDLEADYQATGRKLGTPLQRERLSERDLKEINMKQCIRCLKELDEALFDYRSGKPGQRHNICKPCKLARLQEHRQQMRQLVNRWKEMKGCSSCGFKGHHFQLDLDHINSSSKKNEGNSRAYEPSWSKARIKEELAKCQILCANCHRLKTFLNSDHLQVCDSPAHDENDN